MEAAPLPRSLFLRELIGYQFGRGSLYYRNLGPWPLWWVAQEVLWYVYVRIRATTRFQRGIGLELDLILFSSLAHGFGLDADISANGAPYDYTCHMLLLHGPLSIAASTSRRFDREYSHI